ncbi:hypothetical protein QK414_31250, partial [Pseudomonas aeruginosa]|nr:hypothetical protein [Pseudomonas aeruginosa]
ADEPAQGAPGHALRAHGRPPGLVSGLRRERMVNGMFDDDQPFASEDFGLVSKDNYWEKN